MHSNHLSRCRSSNIRHDVDIGCPRRELRLPGSDGGKRDDDEERPELAHAVEEIRQVYDALHSLAEAHFVGQDTVLALVPKVREPVETRKLEILELVARDGNKVRVGSNLRELTAQSRA